MTINPLAPPAIQVELAVSRFETIPEDGCAIVWGYVGDYEVSICLALDDPRVRALVAGDTSAEKGKPRKFGRDVGTRKR